MTRTPPPLLALPLLLALLAACASTPALDTPELDRAVALPPPAIDALAELLRMEDHRAWDEAAFRRIAGDAAPGDPVRGVVRGRAAMAAGRIGDAAAAAFVSELLQDPSALVRADAAFALGELGDSAAVASLRAAAPAGWVPVRNDDAVAVGEVLHAMGKIGSSAARAHVVDALRASGGRGGARAHHVAGEALLAVWRFEHGGGRIRAVSSFLDAPGAELRWRAAYALMRIAHRDVAAPLLDAMGDDDHRVREYAARGLAWAVVDSAGAAAAARAALLVALGDPHPHVRVNSVRTLAGYEDPPLEALAARLADPDPAVAIAAAGALAGLDGAPAAPLASLARDGRAPMAVRSAALAALAGADPDAAADLLGVWADGDARQRYEAARGLSALDDDRAVPLLRALLTDSDARVVVAALTAAGTHAADSTAPAGRHRDLRTLLLGAARRTQPRIRAVALGGLAPLRELGDTILVRQVYSAAAGRDDARAAAHAALELLERLAEDDSAATRSFFARFGPPDDRWIHRRGARLPGSTWGDPPAAAAAEDLAFYQDAVRRWVVPVLAGNPRPRAAIRTERGEVVIELLSGWAPLTVQNFVRLASAGYYDNGVWHRVVPNFVLQDGAPAGDPGGGPGWAIRDEINPTRYLRGTVGMALSGPDTGGSQWFITHSPQPHLDGGYTVFARVVDGMDFADAVLQGDPIRSIRIRP